MGIRAILDFDRLLKQNKARNALDFMGWQRSLGIKSFRED